MIGATIRFQDFELEAKASLTATATYGQAEVDAIRRSAFAAGQAEGKDMAVREAAATEAERDAAADRLVQEAAALGNQVEALLSDSLEHLEQVLRAALASAVPALAETQAVDALAQALRQAARTIPLPTIEVIAPPATLERLCAHGEYPADRMQLTADDSLAGGLARLRWQSGGADFSPTAAAEAIDQALQSFLTGSREAGGKVHTDQQILEKSQSND